MNKTWIACALFLCGLAVRLAFLNRAGTADIDIDLQWGKDANEFGLPNTYHGNYFPLQYQVFQIAAASGGPVSMLVAFKAINLLADVGVFVLLAVLLRRWHLNPAYAFLFWLHPYFIAISWLGYVDVQFTLFVLLGLLALTRSASLRDYVIAGIPFGLAWLMKPQPLIGGIMIVLYCSVLLVEVALTRNGHYLSRVLRLAALFVAPAILFLSYGIWFTLETRNAKSFLASTYYGTVDFMPVLSAQMLNIWHLVAEYYRTGAQPLWAIEGPDSLHVLAQSVTAILLVAVVIVVWRFTKSQRDDVVVLFLFALGAAVLPMMMTRAHENHFFLAATLLVPTCALLRSTTLTLLVAAFLFLQFIHLFGL